VIPALELLYEESGLPDVDLPAGLRAAYGGTLGFAGATLYTNFVSTLDGVVSIPGTPRSNQVIGDGSEADRLVMALLRACADVVVVGSGTLRGSPGALWTATDAFPRAEGELAELRRRLGKPPEPAFAVATGSGSIDTTHPALEGAVVLTTVLGAGALEGRLPATAELVSLRGDEEVDLRDAVAELHTRGFETILSEAGPTVHGALADAGLVDELFLTVSPLLAGRPNDDVRLGLVEDVSLLPGKRVVGRLLGVRRNGSHLFLRYRLTPGS
jgi:riboflavin biosynthesis pyrimidine reductase